MEVSAPMELILATRGDMVTEAKLIIDTARERGVTLRLVGGLAVRFHCSALDFCERDHGDIDLVGHRRDAGRIASLFADLGFEENLEVRMATDGRQMQFARECRHADEWARYRPHQDDHVDVFLDTFRMDHPVDLTDRLDPDGYTVTVSDVLLTKLQMAHLNEKDERDILALLLDLELGSVGRSGATGLPGVIDLSYITRLCAHDWGLFHDVMSNLSLLRQSLDSYALDPGARDRVFEKLARLEQTIQAEPKSHVWRLRAKIGTHLPWHETVEEQQ